MKKVHTNRNPFLGFAYLIPKTSLLRGSVVIAAIFSVLTASADILTVTSNAGSGGGSLRSMVAAASAGDIVVFDQALDGATITLDGSQITIDKDLTIDGSSLLNGIAINGNAASRLFEVTGGVEVALNSLRLENGADAGPSAILSNGVLRIVNCMILNNGAAGGGAIQASNALILINSTLSDNTGGNVAGIFASRADLIIVGSTISGNNDTSLIFNDGEAIRFESDGVHSLTILNSTISGNSAGNRAGGLTVSGFNSGTLTANIINSTITENSRTSGGGAGGIWILESDSSTVTVTAFDSIISGNTSGGLPTDILGNLDANSANNIVGVGGGLINGSSGNIVGVTDPMLSPLQNNGGPTLTHIPVTGSPAVDATASGESFDQRGVSRPDGGNFDIGAVEGVDHTAARAALNAQIAAQNAAIAALQAQADRFTKKARKAKSKSKSKSKKFKKRARQVTGQIAAARVRVAGLQVQLAALN